MCLYSKYVCIDKQGFDFPSHNLGKGCVLILQNQSSKLHVMSEQHICRAQISGTTESCEDVHTLALFMRWHFWHD